MPYCSSLWSNTTQANLEKLQAVQNFACRILCGAKTIDHVTPLLKDLRWLSVRQQLYFRFAVSMQLWFMPGGGGVLPEKFGRGVGPASQNPYPFFAQNL